MTIIHDHVTKENLNTLQTREELAAEASKIHRCMDQLRQIGESLFKQDLALDEELLKQIGEAATPPKKRKLSFPFRKNGYEKI